ncbi:MAG: radical SAM protein, partial [Acidobacteria bacterium]|nr:radical SAM protein [Acidobacteriota bacterium]
HAADCSVFFTIPFRDDETARALEPFAPLPAARFRAMEALSRAGIKTGIGIAPLAPGLNDSHIPELLKRAREAGAQTAWMTMLRLPGSVAPYFTERLRERLPTRAERILNHIKQERGGHLNSSEFGARMKGTSEQWRMIEQLFKLHCRRLGFDNQRYMEADKSSTFRRPTRQGVLF